MQTSAQQSPDIQNAQDTAHDQQPSREKLPPVEQDGASGSVPTQAVNGMGLAPASQPQTGLGKFLYENRNITKNPVGHVAYQMIRNIAAGIPYGIATILTWDGFEKLAAKTAGAKSGSFKSTVNQISRSPIRDIAMIAAGFTLYRGTLKFVRIMKEHLFNPDYTPDQADEAARSMGQKSLDTFKEIAPAEVNSTPIGAIALGLGRRYVDGIKEYGARAASDKIAAGTLIRAVDGVMPPSASNGAHARLLRFMKDGAFSPRYNFKEFRQKVFSAASKPWAEAGVFILSFLSFFELSDRLYKDVQVRRGVWNGEYNSLARVSPEKAHVLDDQEVANGTDQDAGHLRQRHGIGQHKELFGTSDPNLLRWGFVRLLPTVLGIGAYTFTKRSAYATMGHFSGQNTFWKRVFVEGAATSTFFVMTTSNDIFEGLWKQWFAPKEQGQLLSQHQSDKHAALLAKLNEKEMGTGRAA